MKSIYLDYNSTCPISPKALQAMNQALCDSPLNPSSIHSFGRNAQHLLEQARSLILQNLSARQNYNLLFVGSGSEANNLVLKNFEQEEILISSIEHLSIFAYAAGSSNIKLIQVNQNGYLNLEHLEKLLQLSKTKKTLVSVMLANNETGVLQDMEQIIKLCRNNGAFIHSDLSQVPGKHECALDELDLDFATISSHKFAGPVGIAALLYKKNLHLAAQILGGGQERGMRSGTENVAGAVAMASALAEAQENLSQKIAYILGLRQFLENSIKAFAPNAQVVHQFSNRLCNTSMLIMPGVSAKLQLIGFDLKGIALSSGSACSSGKVANSHVLQACGLNRFLSDCAIRVSLSNKTTKEEVSKFCQVWREIFLKNTNNNIQCAI